MPSSRFISAFFLIITSVAICATPFSALAYKANVGDRAANFKGFDIVSREMIELEDYLGQWVFVEHFATWCGPCIRELPNMIEQTKPYIDSGRLKVITISSDTADTLDELKRIIRKSKMKYPVLYDGGVYDAEGDELPIPALEWGITSWPSSFLINPQGVIVANKIRGEKLGQILDFYLNGNPPLIGLRGFATVNDDRSVSVFAEVMCSTHEPLEVKGDYYYANWVWDEDYILIDEISDHEDLPEPAAITFGDFGEAVHEFFLPPNEENDYYAIWLTTLVPNTEHIGEGERAGIWLEIRTNDIMLVEDFYYDEENYDYRVIP